MSQGKLIEFDYSELYRLYWTEYRSGIEVAKILGVGWYSVYQALHRFGIPVRKKGTACKITEVPHTKGYIRVRIFLGDKYYPMVENDGYCMKHRLAMAKHLGRCLTDDEVVHHIDRDRTNNNIGNLVLLTRQEHNSMGKGANHILKEVHH